MFLNTGLDLFHRRKRSWTVVDQISDCTGDSEQAPNFILLDKMGMPSDPRGIGNVSWED